MEEKSEYASTSIFKSKGLPVSEVMEKYKSVVKEIACTSNIEEENYGTGIIHLDYNLNELSVSKEYEGTACVLKWEICSTMMRLPDTRDNSIQQSFAVYYD